jgi:hypothetical protein
VIADGGRPAEGAPVPAWLAGVLAEFGDVPAWRWWQEGPGAGCGESIVPGLTRHFRLDRPAGAEQRDET